MSILYEGSGNKPALIVFQKRQQSRGGSTPLLAQPLLGDPCPNQEATKKFMRARFGVPVPEVCPKVQKDGDHVTLANLNLVFRTAVPLCRGPAAANGY